MTGPHLHNFAEIARRLDDAGAVRIGADADAVHASAGGLLGDAAARADGGRREVAGWWTEGRGALARDPGACSVAPERRALDARTTAHRLLRRLLQIRAAVRAWTVTAGG